MIQYYIFLSQQSEALLLHTYLQENGISDNVHILDETAMLNTPFNEASIVFSSYEGLSKRILNWFQKQPVIPQIVCIGNNNSIENFKNIVEALNQIKTPLNKVTEETLEQSIPSSSEQALQHLLKEKSQFLFVKSEYKLVKIQLDDVLFLSGLKDYTQIYLKGRKTPITTLKNLKEFEARLSQNEFIRVHRSYIIAISKIEFISRNDLSIDGHLIPIGNAFRKLFDEIISIYS
jgi:DNA-binding LytR/AlgR family response regulator